MRERSHNSLLLIALLVSRVSLVASPTGSLNGSIKDPSGAAVASARIDLISTATTTRRVIASDARGAFQFLQLEPGVYSLAVEASGFKRATVPRAIVQVDQTTRADIVLELGERSEVVEVRAVTPSPSNVIDGRIVSSMPLNARQFLDLALLTPGVLPAAAGTQGNGFNAAGARSQSNVYLLDGVSNQDTQTNDALNSFRISDAVLEFAVQTSVAPPEFGRGSGAQVNIVTKSGSNQFHGSAFEYLRNTKLDAADFFTNKLGGAKNPLHRNQFGATLGGAVLKDRTFFFASYEGFRQVAPAVSATRVPTASERASVTDLISSRLLAFWPAANVAGTLNYISNVRNQDSDDTGLIRIDHKLGEHDRLSSRWVEYRGQSVVPGPTPLTGGNQGPPLQRSILLSEIHTFSPAFLNELRLGYSRNEMQRKVQDFGLNAASIFTSANGTPLPGVVDAARNPLDSGLPSITVQGGYAALGTNANFPQGRISGTAELFENMSFAVSRHSLRWGFHIRREDLRRYLDRASRGAFNFASFADFAKGLATSSNFRTGSTLAYWRRYPWDLYFEDQWRMRDNLTLTYGIRYEYPSAVDEIRGHATNFVPGYGPMLVGTNRILDIDPALKGPSSFIFRQAPFTLPSSGVHSDKNNLAPMLGFAWTPLDATVIRGGFRIGYDDLFNNVPSSMALSPPFNLQTSQTANVTQPGKFPWALGFDQNVPLISNVGKQGPGTPMVGVINFQGVDPDLRSAYVYQYNLGVQRRFGEAFSIEADCVGSSGRRLGIYIDVNQPAVVVRDPTKRGTAAPNEQVFPYNHYGKAQIARSIGNSNYNGLVAVARFQGRRGMYLQGSYTFGKSLDYNSSYFGSGNLPGETGAPVDSTNLRLEHGPSAFDVRHRFNAVYVLELPAIPGLSRSVFGGWQVSGIATVQSGSPFTVVTGGPDSSGFNQANAGTSPAGGDRPDLIRPGPVPQDNHNPDAAFDRTWFTPALAGRLGTSGRNQYYGPALEDYDLAVTKSFPLGERVRLHARADFFNLFNHTNFANPISDMSNVNFGRITQTAGTAVATSVGTTGGPIGGARVIQMSLRLQF